MTNIAIVCTVCGQRVSASRFNAAREISAIIVHRIVCLKFNVSTTGGTLVMGKSLWTISLLFAAIAVPTLVRADIVYTVNQPIGPGSATGFITTDGTIGTLSVANIVGWNLKLNDGTHVTDLTPSNSAVFFGNHDLGIGNVDVAATSLNLLFNYSAPDGGFLSFGGASGQVCYTSWSNCWGPTAVGVYGVGGVGGSVFVAKTGNQVIATAVPEPSSFLLLGSGLGVAITGVRRKLRG